MKEIKETVLYFHDFMTNEDQTKEEIRHLQREFHDNGLLVREIKETETPPFRDKEYYDILLFDWGGAMIGNSCMRHFCISILEEALEKPSKVYIMSSHYTTEAMKEAQKSFKEANGELPANVFLNIKDACKLLLLIQ